ncbi:hypothetical protein BGX33_011169 [Mortierella sp. NVP41]|nr:hypothetical protein BGX33_011169 [Mortierella sp. NVP41]
MENVMTIMKGWSIPIRYDATTEEALMAAVNNTRNIPQTSPTKLYFPRLSEYELACDQLDVGALTSGPLFLPNDGCAAITFIPACETYNYNYQAILATKIGLTSSPTTVLTKCLLTSGEMVSLSTSVVRFSVPSREMFHSVASSIFGDQDEVVLGMEESVNNGTLSNLPVDRQEQAIVMEVKVSGTKVTALLSMGSRQEVGEVPHIACAYTITSALIVKSRPLNPDIAYRLANKGLNPKDSDITAMMILYHLPFVSKAKPSFPISKILNASSVATDYLASLGPNFILDWDEAMLYIAFDTVDIINGYDFPRWLFYTIIGTMVVCLVFWIATEACLEGRYTRSLYWLVSKKLADPQGPVVSRLHRFNTRKLEFEGRRILSRAPEASDEASVYQGVAPGSQEPMDQAVCL